VKHETRKSCMEWAIPMLLSVTSLQKNQQQEPSSSSSSSSSTSSSSASLLASASYLYCSVSPSDAPIRSVIGCTATSWLFVLELDTVCERLYGPRLPPVSATESIYSRWWRMIRIKIFNLFQRPRDSMITYPQYDLAF
jgi:hypothetical protein